MEALRLADESDDLGLKAKAHLILAWNLNEARGMEGAIRGHLCWGVCFKCPRYLHRGAGPTAHPRLMRWLGV